MRDLYVIILAAGNGKRMQSQLPKVLHEVGGLTLMGHVLKTAEELGALRTCVVISPHLQPYFQDMTGFDVAIQDTPLGTGHAVMSALPWLKEKEGDVLVLCGDVPFLSADTLNRLRHKTALLQTSLGILGMTPQNAGRYGRIFCDEKGLVEKIVEFNDLPDPQTAPSLCNAGMMLADCAVLRTLLPKLENKNASQEYYLTDLVGLGRTDGVYTCVEEAPEEELLGVNSQKDLAKAEATFQATMRDRAFEQGVRMRAPETVFFSYDTEIAPRVTIEPYVIFGPGVRVAEGACIKSFSHLEDTHVGSQAAVGPYARCRPGTVVGEGSKVGNFVELKKTTLEAGAKVNHLSYVGDAFVGSKANIGAGTITCNYDGYVKSRTHIGAGAFIGSNSALVAPVTIGDHALVAAGSVVTEEVPAGAMAFGRAHQSNKDGGGARYREKAQSKGK